MQYSVKWGWRGSKALPFCPRGHLFLSVLTPKILLLEKNMFYYVIRIQADLISLGEVYIYKFTFFTVSIIVVGSFSNGQF